MDINLDDPGTAHHYAIRGLTFIMDMEFGELAPAVPVPFGAKGIHMIPRRAIITMQRIGPDITVDEVELTGARAKKDGTASKLLSSGRWTRRRTRDGLGYVYGYDEWQDHPFVLSVIRNATAALRGELR